MAIVPPAKTLDHSHDTHELVGERSKRLTLDWRCDRTHMQLGAFQGDADQVGIQFDLVLDVSLLFAPLYLVERRLRDIHVASTDEFRHLPIKKCQQQCADVRAVHVRVRHDDDAVVAKFLDVEILAANAAAKRRDQRADLVACQHAIEARLLDVQDLAL